MQGPIHIIGIAGAGCSALAGFLADSGYTVTGSDAAPAPAFLKEKGVATTTSAHGIPSGTQTVIYSLAIPSSHPERVAAEKQKLPTFSYPEALGRVTRAFRPLVAVCGTHGKTTTTSLIAAGLIAAKLQPSVVVGAELSLLEGRGYRLGTGPLVVEACEYKEAFLQLSPDVIVLTSCDHDHIDYFKTPESYRAAFLAFIQKLPPTGSLIAHADAPPELTAAVPKVLPPASSVPPLAIPGSHNRANAALALTACSHLGADVSLASNGISAFTGATRRFQLRGEVQGATLIDDYAHHPVEVAALLAATRERFGTRRIVLVYQQHQAARATAFASELVQAFAAADELLLLPVYAAREEDGRGASERLTEEAVAGGVSARFCPSFSAAENTLRELIQKGDVVLLAGAGDIPTLTSMLFKKQG